MNAERGCFIDSNIWLYAFIQTDDPNKCKRARDVIKEGKEIAVSVQVVNEISVNLLKKASVAEAVIRDIVIAFYKKYRMVALNETVLTDASRLREAHSFSYWDSLIISAALASKVPVLYTEDMQHGRVIDGVLRIVNPFIPT